MIQKKYGELLLKVLPKKIETDKEYKRFLTEINDLIDIGENNRSIEEDALLILLVDLVENFEDIACPIFREPSQFLKFLLDERNLTPKDLLPFFESEQFISDILNNDRGIGKRKAKELGKYFNVPPGLFIEN